MEKEIATRLATLGHPQRLAIFRLLVRRHPGRVPAGEIARALGLPASTLSSHLAALLATGLAARERQGTSLLYGVAMEAVRETLDFLFLDCCRGRPEACAPLLLPQLIGEARAMTDRKFNVLFLCTGNSARSIMAEAILRAEAGDRFNAFSAGTRPAGAVHPLALDLLQSLGHDTGSLRSKDLDEFTGERAPQLDFVFTVCDRAANEECPIFPGVPVTAHWGVPDPAAVEGDEITRRAAFRDAYARLQNRIRLFAALPLESLDRLARQREADAIARACDKEERHGEPTTSRA
ncbi:arsenate reductase [Meinhardsimonia xiamenensis]|jgi:arsenate reductase|uniref:Arsenate reductase n=1 Tax=Meinhardsimonia xiamenensis TaxID=990712 RepID=A0A1G9FLP2_9RHOB|nr:metalloregulator ArsR/SmtB family transcription factor [Meinhardsimonia xiamenensis]PRX37782.1 arsenate reductase [Meinhardsimonia xiamenensis]SDK89289.1 arsenate reductase [Meinhardsimonia xiamenensis]